jgi:hypothetical protein
MAKTQSLADLKQIAIAKHGENKAWSLAIQAIKNRGKRRSLNQLYRL